MTYCHLTTLVRWYCTLNFIFRFILIIISNYSEYSIRDSDLGNLTWKFSKKANTLTRIKFWLVIIPYGWDLFWGACFFNHTSIEEHWLMKGHNKRIYKTKIKLHEASTKNAEINWQYQMRVHVICTTIPNKKRCHYTVICTTLFAHHNAKSSTYEIVCSRLQGWWTF